MALDRRWIKLGRLFMVAWLGFFIYPLSAFLTDRFSTETRVGGLLLLLALALIWAWFWTRICAEPDRRFTLPAIVATTLILTLFTRIVILALGGSASKQIVFERLRDFLAVAVSRSVKGELWIVEPGRIRVRLEKDSE